MANSWKRIPLGNGFFRRAGSPIVWKRFHVGGRAYARSLDVQTIAEAKKVSPEIEARLREELSSDCTMMGVVRELPPNRFWDTVKSHLPENLSDRTTANLEGRITRFMEHAESVGVKDFLRLGYLKTRQVVASFVRSRAKQVKGQTVKNDLIVLSRGFSALIKAAIWNAPNPASCKLHELPDVQATTKRRLTVAEDETIRLHLRDDKVLWPVLALMRLGGLRPAECRALLWRDVNFHEGFIRVQGRGKRKRGRLVPMSKTLVAELQAVRIQQGKNFHDDGPVCAGKRGKAIVSEFLAHRFGPWVVSLGLPSDVTLYALRRTLAQDMMDAGASVEDCVAILGNSFCVLQKHYADLCRSKKAGLMDAVVGPRWAQDFSQKRGLDVTKRDQA